MCGLKLDAIAAELIAQKPSPEMAALLQKRKRVKMLGVFSLSTAAIIALSLLLAVAFYYKLQIFGPDLLFGSAIGALILFLLISAFLFLYPKLFLKEMGDIKHHFEEEAGSTRTNRLLNEPPFEPASVTEHSTEPLLRK
ncbi:MAG: hypothetical protein ABL999_00850 [Pyrinomonadaceae bacterium]